MALIESSPGFALCTGHAYRNFITTKYLICDYENAYGKFFCRIWSYTLVSLFANIFDGIFFYLCTKEIKQQTESSKSMLTEQQYTMRRRYVFLQGSMWKDKYLLSGPYIWNAVHIKRSGQYSYVSIKHARIFILFGNLLLPYTALSEPAHLIKLKETSYLHNLFS